MKFEEGAFGLGDMGIGDSERPGKGDKVGEDCPLDLPEGLGICSCKFPDLNDGDR